jgi:HD-like signal output (HDOD) protein
MQELANRIEAAAWDRQGADVRGRWTAKIEVLLPAPPLFNELSSQHLTLENFDAHELADKVGHDAVLGGRILGVANSARFGLRQPMTSIPRAWCAWAAWSSR